MIRAEEKVCMGKRDDNIGIARGVIILVIAFVMTFPMNSLILGGGTMPFDDILIDNGFTGMSGQPSPEPKNNRARQVTDLEEVWYPEYNGLGTFLVGTGQRIGLVTMDCVDRNHPDLQSRVTHIDPFPGTEFYVFDTHLAGTIIGNGHCYESVEGLPTGDRYYNGFAGVCPEGDLIVGYPLGTSDWNAMVASGACVIVNAWGGGPGDYNADCASADTLMNGNDNVLILFVSGKSGPQYRTISGGGNSWCGLSVGASENDRPERGRLSDDANTLYEGTSRGPMTSGRIKPDIVAPSTYVISTKPSNPFPVEGPNDIPGYNHYNPLPSSDYTTFSYSSAKASFVAGSYALVRQYLMDIEGYADPNRVLVKALLLNGAEDMGYGYPSYEAGWGRVNVKNSIVPDAPRVNQWAEGSLSTGQTWDFTTNGGANTFIESDRVPLKVMLVWDMPAGALMSNDYELEVTSPSGVVYKGNCFDQSGTNDDWSHPDPDSLFWNTLGSPTAAPPYGFDYDTDNDNDDDINNVEAVFVEKPEVGQWTVTVRSDSTPNSPRFAVAWGADTGPISNYHVELSTDVSTTMRSARGGTLAFPFDILNFGTLTDTINFIDDADADLTVTYSEPSPLAFDPNEEKDIIAQIGVSPTATLGRHEFTFTGISLDDPGSPPGQDKIIVKIDVVDAGLPPTYQVTTNGMSQYGPSVVAFTDSGGTDHVLIAYASEEGVVNGNRVFVSHTTDDLTIGSGTWTHAQVSTQADMPGDIRITNHPSGIYQDRVYISWNGRDPTFMTGAWTYCAYADPPYTIWSPVQVMDDSESGMDDIWRMTMTATHGDEVWLIAEALEYSGVTLMGVDTFSRRSLDGGVTWPTLVQVSPGDGNLYFFPNAFTDYNGNIVVYYYWRTPAGTDRDLCYNYYDGSWNPPGSYYSIWNNPFNSMHPVGTSTLEGPGGTNRLYCFFTYGTTTTSPKDGYVLWADTSSGYPTNDGDWTLNEMHPDIGGSTISDVDYGNRPILDIDATFEGGNWYVWTEYLEEQADYNPYGINNVHNCVSDDGYATMNELDIITADSYTKSHQAGDSLGAYKYEVYNSYSGDLATGNMDVWLKVYHYGWQSDLDILGPVTSMVAGTPNPCERGVNLEITANIDDTSAGYSDIAAAEWCEGATPSWPGTSMSPYDGLFDNPTEAVIDTVSTMGWSFGEHIIWVRGQDAQGNWGAAASATIYIIPGPPQPPWVDLTAPDGGEVWMGGSSQTITWDMGDNQDLIGDLIVDLYYSTDSGSTFPNVIATGLTGFPSNPCEYAWDPVPSLDLSTVRVRVNVTDTSALFDSDDSAADFTIDSTAPAPATNVRAELTATHVTIYWDPSADHGGGDNDVDRYEIYYILNNWDPTGDSYGFLVDMGMATSYQHSNAGVNNPSSYCWQVRTFDVAGHETRTIIQAAKTGSMQSTFANPSGWFMLGSHLVQSDTSLAHVIQGAGLPANWDYAQVYDAVNGDWYSNIVGRPDSQDDLWNITHEQGFWLHLTASTRFATAGYVEDMSVDAAAGWNLVPYPYAMRTRNTDNIEVDLIANCPNYVPGSLTVLDPGAPYRLRFCNPPMTLAHGMAFWIQVTADTAWTVINY